MPTKNSALITGATSGIGRATAEILAENKFDLILTGRRGDRLRAVQGELQKKYGVHVDTLTFDIQKREQVEKALASVKNVTVLINNAGLAAGIDKMQEANLEDWEAMIDTNVKGLLYVTRALLPQLIEIGNSHIVNVGSVAGRWVYPGGGVYCASKFAVRALSEGLRFDLAGTSVRVTNIEPGMVATEFSEVRLQSSERAKAVYKGMTPLVAKDVAECIWWSLSRPKHVNIQELVVFPTDQAAVGHVHRSSN